MADQHLLSGGQDDLGVAASVVPYPQRVAFVGEVGIAVHQCGGFICDYQIGVGFRCGVCYAPGQADQQGDGADHQPAHPDVSPHFVGEAAQELILGQLPHGLFRPLPPRPRGAHHAGVQEPCPDQPPNQREHVAQPPPEHPESTPEGSDLLRLAEGFPAIPHAAPGELDVGPKLLQSFFHNTSMISILPPG